MHRILAQTRPRRLYFDPVPIPMTYEVHGELEHLASGKAAGKVELVPERAAGKP